jgi:hypothetical protein
MRIEYIFIALALYLTFTSSNKWVIGLSVLTIVAYGATFIIKKLKGKNG